VKNKKDGTRKTHRVGNHQISFSMFKSFSKISTLACVVFVMAMNSCTIARISGKGAVPVLLNQPGNSMQLVEHITIKKNRNFNYTNSFDVSEVIAMKVAQAKPDAVINTTVTLKYGIDNFFLNLITLGFAQSQKIVIDADLMKEKK
jgi:hypothetical protein